jgi:cytoskeletal protein RodZ
MERIITDIGSRLRQAREVRGLTLRDIATTTKISMSALTAMERNEFARLPGGVFRRAYVKAFAREVGLNADELAGEYRAAFEAEPTMHSPAQPHRHPGFRFAPRVPAALAAVAAVAIWGAAMLHRRVEPEATVPPPSVSVPSAVRVSAAPALRLEIHTTAQCWVSAAADGDRAV